MEMGKELFRLEKVTKIYPGTVALDEVDFSLRQGEIHALLGKNGAGKSTLTGIMYGSVQPTSGTVKIKGETVGNMTPWAAKEQGVFLVPQHPEFALDLTVAENLYLGKFPKTSRGFIDKKKMLGDTEILIRRLGINVLPGEQMERVSLEYRQLLLAAKAFWVDCSDIIMLDEITATLSLKSRTRLFELLTEIVSKERKAVVFITHRLQEAMEISNRVTVIRNGKNIGTYGTKELDREHLVRLITGESSGTFASVERRGTPNSSEGKSLQVKGLGLRNQFEDISLEIRKSEIVGLAGLEGAGGGALMRCMAGACAADSGQILCNKEEVRLSSPGIAIKKGIVYLTQDREVDGVIQGCSIEHNVITNRYADYVGKSGLIRADKVTDKAAGLTHLLSVKMSSQKMEIDTLSGGNKQKVMIARLIEKQPDYYLLDHITQGVDIHAKHEILDIVRNMLSEHAGILVSSESIEELMEICDRIAVMYKGRLVAEIAQKDFTEERIFSCMQGFVGD